MSVVFELFKMSFWVPKQDQNAVAIRTAPVRRLEFAIRTGVRRFH